MQSGTSQNTGRLIPHICATIPVLCRNPGESPNPKAPAAAQLYKSSTTFMCGRSAQNAESNATCPANLFVRSANKKKGTTRWASGYRIMRFIVPGDPTAIERSDPRLLDRFFKRQLPRLDPRRVVLLADFSAIPQDHRHAFERHAFFQKPHGIVSLNICAWPLRPASLKSLRSDRCQSPTALFGLPRTRTDIYRRPF